MAVPGPTRVSSSLSSRLSMRGSSLPLRPGLQTRAYVRQDLARHPGGVIALGIDREPRIGNRVQNDVVEGDGRGGQHVDELLDDLGGTATQTEGVGDLARQEVDNPAAGLEVGGVVEVRPHFPLVLERLRI